MAQSRAAQDRRIARGAVLALHQAICSHRQHPGNEPLLHAVLRRCVDTMRAATLGGSMTMSLLADGVHVAGEAVLPFAPSEPPFGPLRRAGIGQVVLHEGLCASEVESLVRHLAAITQDADPERTVQRLLDDHGLVHVRLLAAPLAEGAANDPSMDWSQLPALTKIDPQLQAFVARDLASNLPAMAAQQLLEEVSADPRADGVLLVRLLARVLAEHDLATASWLLAEVDQHPQLPAEVRAEVRAAAVQRADDAWLRHELEQGTRDELMNVIAFVMQLGDDVTARFAQQVHGWVHPLADWLADLLPCPRQA